VHFETNLNIFVLFLGVSKCRGGDGLDGRILSLFHGFRFVAISPHGS